MHHDFPQPAPRDPHAPPVGSQSHPDPSERNENTTRKIQKADREKLRRDRLNEQFVELGNALDPDRPKNDKATILIDTIQLLKDLTGEVDKLKAEYVVLTEESRELTQEKNDLKEEKASLKSDIENLNIQVQHRSRAMFPWGSLDHSVVMAPAVPASYPYPMPMAMPSGPISMHPSVPPYAFFASPNPNMIPSSCPTFVPYMTPPTTQVEQLPGQYGPPLMPCGNVSHVSSNVDNRSKLSGERKSRNSGNSNEVTTDLELKTPGSTGDRDSCPEQRKPKRSHRRDENTGAGSSSSRCSSPRSIQDSSSNSIAGGGSKADD